MKNIAKIFAVACASLAVACTPETDYNWVPFVSFTNGSSAKVAEDCGKYEIPVALYNYDSDVTVAVTVVGGTAVEGEDYTIEGGTTLTIKPGEPAAVTINVLPHSGVYTGDKTISFKLTPSADSDVVAGASNTFSLTIEDKDFNYDWDWLLGEWNAQDTKNGANAGSAYKINITKVNDTTVTVSNLWDVGSDLTATVNFDKKSLVLKMGYAFTDEGIDFTFYGFDGSSLYSTIQSVWTPGSIVIGPYAVYNLNEGGYFPYVTTITR